MTDFFLWPAGILPSQPLNEQYQVKPADLLSRTMFEQGPARQNLENRLALATYSVVWPMTPQRKLVFDGIVKNQLHNGADWFAIDVFTHNTYQQLIVRFAKNSIRPTRAGGEWMIAATLETYDSQVPSNAATNAMITTLGGTPFAGSGLYVWQSDVLPPQPLNESIQIEPPDTLNRSDFTEGAIDQPSSYVNGPGLYTLSWPLRQAQKFVFDGVLEHRLKKGSAPFLIDLFVNDAYRQVKVRFVKGSLSFARSGDDWTVTAQLEVDDLIAPSVSDTVDGIIAVKPSLSEAAAEALLEATVSANYPVAA